MIYSHGDKDGRYINLRFRLTESGKIPLPDVAEAIARMMDYCEHPFEIHIPLPGETHEPSGQTESQG